jgi:nicotinate-nucleotide adenylyltransferase
LKPTAATAPRRIGLFGGSFDPPHNAHLALARAARDALALDELRWLPAGLPWQKSRTPSAAGHRRAMVEAAIAGEPCMALEAIELERSGPSYTIDTVQALAAREPGCEWWLLIGQDQHANLASWERWRELLARVRLAVAVRPGVSRAAPPEVAAFRHVAIPMPAMDLSATALRAAVAVGADISQLVPPGVARYIDLHGLYLPDHRPDHRS